MRSEKLNQRVSHDDGLVEKWHYSKAFRHGLCALLLTCRELTQLF